MSFFLNDRFPIKFGKVHLEIIDACIKSMKYGTSITVAAPRGFGKTSILWGMSLYGVLTGLRRFILIIGWKADASRELLDQWLQVLSENDLLREYYPCQCDVFKDSTAGVRLKTLLRDLDKGELCGADVQKSRSIIILPAVKEGKIKRGHVVLGAASMNGSIKGKNIGLVTGENLRPDVALLDDPQDEETAQSAMQVDKVVTKINYGIRSLSPPNKRITVMAAVTCVTHGDVSEHLINRAGTKSIKIGQIMTWPVGWKEEKSITRMLWDEWNQKRVEGLEKLDGGAAAQAFYKEHKKELTAGMSVSWDHRKTENDDKKLSDPDAMYAAMWDFYELGEFAFMAERQNEPIKQGISLYDFKPIHVLSKINRDRAGGELPIWSSFVLAATDVNPSYGLTTVIASFGLDEQCAILDYGVDKIKVGYDLPDADKKRQIMKCLEKHGQEKIKVCGVPDIWGIDGGGSPQDTVNDFCFHSERTCGVKAITMFGRAYRYVKPKSIDLKFEQCFIRQESRYKRWIIWNADYWKEIAQKSWLGAFGSPGSSELPRGKHEKFAEQICREQLADKAELAGSWAYSWNTVPGKPHDYGDCMAMLFALAATQGIGTGQAPVMRRKKRKRISYIG